MLACAIGRTIHPQAGHQPSMIWYSPLVPLLSGMMILVIAALMARPGEQPRRLLRARTGLVLMGLLLAVPGYALMTPLGANLLVLIVEYRTRAAEPAPVCDQVETAVLLSGGLNRPAESISDFSALTPESLARVFAWRAQVATEGTDSQDWIIAGGGPFRISEAEVISAFLNRLDPDREPLRLETASANTRESALAIRKLLPASSSRVLVASSALHLPRATLAFEQAGFDVCPLALNRHYLAATGWTALLPQSSSLAKSESALHELIGEIFYRFYPPDTYASVSNSPGTRE